MKGFRISDEDIKMKNKGAFMQGAKLIMPTQNCESCRNEKNYLVNFILKDIRFHKS